VVGGAARLPLGIRNFEISSHLILFIVIRFRILLPVILNLGLDFFILFNQEPEHLGVLFV